MTKLAVGLTLNNHSRDYVRATIKYESEDDAKETLTLAHPLLLDGCRFADTWTATGVGPPSAKLLDETHDDSSMPADSPQSAELLRTANFDVYTSGASFAHQMGMSPRAIYLRQESGDAKLSLDALIDKLWSVPRGSNKTTQLLFDVARCSAMALEHDRRVHIADCELDPRKICGALMQPELEWFFLPVQSSKRTMLLCLHMPSYRDSNSGSAGHIFFYDPNGDQRRRESSSKAYLAATWKAIRTVCRAVADAAASMESSAAAIFRVEDDTSWRVDGRPLIHLIESIRDDPSLGVDDTVHPYLRRFDRNGGVSSAICAWIVNVVSLNPSMTPMQLCRYIQMRNAQWSREDDSRQRDRIYDIMHQLVASKHKIALKDMHVGDDEVALDTFATVSADGHIRCATLTFQPVADNPLKPSLLVRLMYTTTVHDDLVRGLPIGGNALQQLQVSVPDPAGASETLPIGLRTGFERRAAYPASPPYRQCIVDEALVEQALRATRPSQVAAVLQTVYENATVVGGPAATSEDDLPRADLLLRTAFKEVNGVSQDFYDIVDFDVRNPDPEVWKECVRFQFKDGKPLATFAPPGSFDMFCIRTCDGMRRVRLPPRVEPLVHASDDEQALLRACRSDRTLCLTPSTIMGLPDGTAQRRPNAELPGEFAVLLEQEAKRALVERGVLPLDVRVAAICRHDRVDIGANLRVEGRPVVVFRGWEDLPVGSSRGVYAYPTASDGTVLPAKTDTPVWRFFVDDFATKLLQQGTNIYASPVHVERTNARPCRAIIDVFDVGMRYFQPTFRFMRPFDVVLSPIITLYAPDWNRLQRTELKKMSRTGQLAQFLYQHDGADGCTNEPVNPSTNSRQISRQLVDLRIDASAKRRRFETIMRKHPLLTNWMEVQIVIFLEYAVDMRRRMWNHPLPSFRYGSDDLRLSHRDDKKIVYKSEK